MRRWIAAALLLLPLAVWSQGPRSISGTLSGGGGKTVYLLSYYGERNRLVDSVACDPSGSFSFRISPTTLPGMFKVSWGKDNWIDVVYEGENIRFTTPVALNPDSLRFIGSTPTQVYYEFMAVDQRTHTAMDLLQQIIDYYPMQNQFLLQTAAEYDRVQRAEERALDSLSRIYPGSYAIRICKVYATPYVPAALPPEMRMAYLRQHYLDSTNFNDTSLLRSNAFTNKAISYLSLYSNNRLDQKQLEAEFIKAVTVLMNAASVNPEVYKFYLDYLVGGFDKYHFEDVIAYMAENFKDPFSCEDEDQKSALQKRLDNFKKIAIGSPAPALEAPDPKGAVVKVSAINAPYTLLLFYSSECPHCEAMIPKVKQLYEGQKPKKMEVVAYSLDTSKDEWLKFIKAQKLTWINVSELQGFDSKGAEEFNIYATPTMFLLDKNKKILAKPISYNELEQVLREQGLL